MRNTLPYLNMLLYGLIYVVIISVIYFTVQVILFYILSAFKIYVPDDKLFILNIVLLVMFFIATLFTSFVIPLFVYGLSKNVNYFFGFLMILIPLMYISINIISNGILIATAFIAGIIIPLFISKKTSSKYDFDNLRKKLLNTTNLIVSVTVFITIYFATYAFIVGILKYAGNVQLLNLILYIQTFIFSILIRPFVKKRYAAVTLITIVFSIILVTNFLYIPSWKNFAINFVIAALSIGLVYLLKRYNASLFDFKFFNKGDDLRINIKEIFFHFFYVLLSLLIIIQMHYFFKYGYRGDMAAVHAYIIFISSFFLLTKTQFFKVFIFILYLLLAFIISFESFNLITNIAGCLLGAGGAILYTHFYKKSNNIMKVIGIKNDEE